MNLPKERIKKLIVLEKPEKLLDFLKVRKLPPGVNCTLI